MRIPALLLILLAGATAAAEEELSRPAGKLLESALRTAKGSRVRDRQREKLVKEAEELTDGDLAAVVARLRAETEPLKSLAEVRELFSRMHVRRRWGEEAMERLPDLLDRLDKRAADARKGLLIDALRLEDLRLARELVVSEGASPIPAVRGRAALAAACLITWGEATDEVRSTLGVLLEDGDPGVRVLAIRAGFHARYDPAYLVAVERLDDGVGGTVDTDGEAKSIRPGEEALEQLRELTRLDFEFECDDFLIMKKEDRESVRDVFRTWWEEKGGAFPPPGFREAVFRATPTRSDARVLGDGETSLSFQFWAGLDRTKIRLTVEEIELFATSPADWRVHYHALYMAQGMRVDDGEIWVRHQPVSTRRVLARKAIGCYVLSFQPLFDARLKVRLDFHDPMR